MHTNNPRTLCRLFAAFTLLLLPVFVSDWASAQGKPQITQAVDPAARKVLGGTVHPLANSANDRGRADASLPMKDMLLMLHPSAAQQAQARKLVDDLHNPHSPLFHHWLTPAQYGAQFGAADEDVATVSSWLTSSGFKIEQVGTAKNWIRFSGNAQQVEQAFATQIHKYEVNGATHYANSTNLSIPAAFTPVVTGVVSTHNFLKAPQHTELTQIARNKSGKMVRVNSPASASAPASTVWQTGVPAKIAARPAFTGVGDEVVNYLSPGDYATIYNSASLVAGGNDGTGSTIAIVGRSDVSLSDIEAFRTIFNLPFNDPNVIYATTDPGIVSGDDVEADLDIEWSSAVAPHATIDYVIGASTNATDGVDISTSYIVDHVTAPIMSVSFGACEADVDPAEVAFFASLWQQAAAEGITVLVSAGDAGASGCIDPSEYRATDQGFGVNALASTPDNVAVGGTEFNESNISTYWNLTNNANQSSALGYIPEAVWNESCNTDVSVGFTNCYFDPTDESTYAGGGGASSCAIQVTDDQGNTSCVGYPKPAWQTGATVPQDGVRDLPDVSLASAAAHDGFLLCTEGVCQWSTASDGSIVIENAAVIGGTSAASPSMAGIMALVEQKNGQYQGQANYTLYKLAAQSGATCDSSQRTDPTAGASCIFNDLTAGANSLTCTVGSPNCVAGTDPTWGELAGYDAVTGFDLASGLGSVNIANLVSAWGNATTLGSATALKVSSASFAHGTPVTVNVGVTAATGGGTPTGEIALLTDKYGSVDAGTLTSGAFSGSVSNLPGGTYNLTARYAGDATYGSSTSQAVALTVTPEASTATGTTWALSRFYVLGRRPIVQLTATQLGNTFWFQVQIAGASGAGVPTGTVTLSSAGKPLGTYPLDENGTIYIQEGPGQAFDPGLGAYTIEASYSGDSSFQASTTTFPFTINQGVANYYLSVNNQQPAAGTSVVGMVTVVGDPSVVPTGTVQFKRQDTGAAIGAPVSLDKTGVATLTFVPPAGTYFLDATYSGDTNYIAGSGDHQPELIVGAASGAATSTTLQAATSQASVGKLALYNVVTTPTASTKLIPSGTVTLYSSYGQVSNAANIVNGKASVPVEWDSAGPESVYAVYSGDTNFAPSSSGNVMTSVAQGTPAVTLSAAAAYVQTGALTSVSAIITGLPQDANAPLPSGSVQFYDAANGAAAQALGTPQPLATGNGTGVGIATLAAVLPAGTNIVTAQYLGDSNWAATAAPGSVGVLVTTPDFTATAAPATLAVTAGETGTVTINTAQILGFASQVTLSCGGTLPEGTSCSIAPGTVAAGQSATLSFSTTVPGTTGSAAMHPFGSVPGIVSGITSLACVAMFFVPGRRRRALWLAVLLSVAIGSGIAGCGGGSVTPTSIVLSSSDTKVASGSSVQLSALVSASHVVSGTVTFYDGSTAIGSPVVPTGSVSTLTTSSLAVGTHAITAKFSGDSNDGASQSSDVLDQTITGAFTLQVNAVSGALSHTISIPATLN
jgi:hypothetical protein